MDMSFKYRRASGGRWKWVVTRPYRVHLHEFREAPNFTTPYFSLTRGHLFLDRAFLWDGASGPAFDTRTFIRGSSVHDALCQAINTGLLPRLWQIAADRVLRRIIREDNMWKPRTIWVYFGVRWFGGLYRIADRFWKNIRYGGRYGKNI